MDKVRIPRLGEYIDAVMDASDVTLNIELKGAPGNPDLVPGVQEYADLVASVFEQQGIVQRTFLQSFDWRLPLAVRDRVPGLKIGLTSDLQPDGDPQGPLPGNPSPWQCESDIRDHADLPSMVKSLGADVWSSNHLDVDQSLVTSAHDQGVEVYVWTVNRETHIRQMIELGVDAITTDYPDRALDLLRS
jgi:glycerophosphoryl diester phosphodiesterase